MSGRVISLARPDITEAEIEAVKRVLATPVLAAGPETAAFEKEFASYAGVADAAAVSSGTAALHLIFASLGIRPGDEVITTPFSFVASANAILFVGAKPVFADIDPETLNLDPGRVERAVTGKTRAILAVHIFGLISEMRALRDIADKAGLVVVEDACEALGATLEGRKAGAWSRAAAFGFYPNKQITTGEGGMVVSDDAELMELARSMRNQGRSADAGWLDHVRLGYNYRMPEISAALGRAQLARVEEILAKRRGVARAYETLLADVDEARPLGSADDPKRSWFVYVVRLGEGIDRDRVVERLARRGIQSRAYFPPIHLMKHYREQFGFREGDFPVAEAVSRTTLALPFHTALTDEDIGLVVDALKEAVARGRR